MGHGVPQGSFLEPLDNPYKYISTDLQGSGVTLYKMTLVSYIVKSTEFDHLSDKIYQCSAEANDWFLPNKPTLSDKNR